MRRLSATFPAALLVILVATSTSASRFSDAPQFATAQEPIAIASGDFNGDGKLDLAVPSVSNSVVSILLGNGSGGFKPHHDFPSGSESNSVTVADFNRDGKLDLAIGLTHGGSISILLGNGDGTFQPKTSVTLGSSAEVVTVGDFNGDGIPDLVGPNALYPGHSIGVLIGNGDGTFQPAVKISVDGSAGKVGVGDLNGDGKQDLVLPWASKFSGGLDVLLGNGNGTFSAPVTYPDEIEPDDIALADFNNDGKLDVVTSNAGFASSGTTVSVYLGNGDGTLQTHTNFTTGSYPVGVCVGDLNSDGKIDIVVPDFNDNAVSVLLGKGDGTFQRHVEYGTGNSPSGLVLGNFTKDTKLDIVVPNSLSNTVSSLIGNGDGTLQARRDYTVGTNPTNVASGDFNGDGLADLVTANQQDDTISVLIAAGKGTFQLHVDYTVPYFPKWVTSGDVNGDGKLDLVVAINTGTGGNGFVSVLLGNGDGTFQSHVEYNAGLIPVFVTLGDLNGDGHLDAVVTNYSAGGNETVSVLLGNGDGSYGSPVAYAIGPLSYGTALADLNGDGRLDLVATSSDPSGSMDGVTVLLGNGDGTFQPKVFYPTPEGPNSVAIGDVNGDGKLDLVTGDGGTNQISVLLGNGDGTFQPHVDYSAPRAPVAVLLADFNGDGKLDVATTNSPAFNLSVFFGNGDGTFQPHQDYGTRTYPVGIATADFNGDGSLDLATANSAAGFGNTVSVLLNTGGTIVAAGSSPNPSQSGQIVKFSASVSPSVTGSTIPTGSITFKDGNTVLKTVTLSQGRAQFSTATLSIGTHTITTSYSGDANFNPKAGPTITQVVNP